MGLLSGTNPVGTIVSAITGSKGIAGIITDILQRVGVMKGLTTDEKAAIQKEADSFEESILSEDNDTIKIVNQTIQAEATNEHFLVWSWRPVTAYAYIIMLLVNYAVCPLIKIPSAIIPSELHYTVLAILGVASYFRGKTKLATVNNTNE